MVKLRATLMIQFDYILEPENYAHYNTKSGDVPLTIQEMIDMDIEAAKDDIFGFFDREGANASIAIVEVKEEQDNGKTH